MFSKYTQPTIQLRSVTVVGSKATVIRQKLLSENYYEEFIAVSFDGEKADWKSDDGQLASKEIHRLLNKKLQIVLQRKIQELKKELSTLQNYKFLQNT